MNFFGARKRRSGGACSLDSSGDEAIPQRRCAPKRKKLKKMKQMHLDAGQRNFGATKCPHCNMIVVAGTEERPVALTCSGCSGVFTLTAKVVKVEIECPACERKLRIRPRPGSRQLDCPACDSAFNVTF